MPPHSPRVPVLYYIAKCPLQKLFAKVPLVVILIELNRQLGSRKMWFLLLRKDAAMAQKDNDLQKIKELIEIMKDNELVEIEITHGDDKILLKRLQAQLPTETAVPKVGPNTSAAPAGLGVTEPTEAGARPSVAEPQPAGDLVEIKSPIVGTFYATPSPDSEPFVELGSAVKPQTVVCIVEAMKVMNEIKAETNGTIAEILVTNGQAVEYGQVLFKVKED